MRMGSMPAGCGCGPNRAPAVAWAGGITAQLSVLGATLAVFIALNWAYRGRSRRANCIRDRRRPRQGQASAARPSPRSRRG